MRRGIAKWLISRALDGDGRLPDWLRRWVDSDEVLTRFEMASRRLGQRLSSDAPAWMTRRAATRERNGKSEPSDAIRSHAATKRRRLAWPLAACAMAASTCFVLASWRLAGAPAADPPSAVEEQRASVASVATLPETRDRWSMTAWQMGRDRANQWQAQLANLPRRWEEITLFGVSTIVIPAEVAGSTAGQALSKFNDGIESQGEELTSDMKSSLLFFAYRLPASTAKLVGLTSLQPGFPR